MCLAMRSLTLSADYGRSVLTGRRSANESQAAREVCCCITPELTRERINKSAGEARAVNSPFVGFNDSLGGGAQCLASFALSKESTWVDLIARELKYTCNTNRL